MQYYLLLKEHNNTGLKYLCKFTEGVKIKCPFKYKGSGKYWKRHLNKHGNNINTNILYKGNSEQELSAHAILWSNVYDVVNNKEFANLIPENGFDGGGVKGSKRSAETRAKMRISSTGRKHTIESRRKMSLARLGYKLTEQAKKKLSISSTGNKHWLGRKHSEETKKKIRLTLINRHLNNKTKI